MAKAINEITGLIKKAKVGIKNVSSFIDDLTESHISMDDILEAITDIEADEVDIMEELIKRDVQLSEAGIKKLIEQLSAMGMTIKEEVELKDIQEGDDVIYKNENWKVKKVTESDVVLENDDDIEVLDLDSDEVLEKLHESQNMNKWFIIDQNSEIRGCADDEDTAYTELVKLEDCDLCNVVSYADAIAAGIDVASYINELNGSSSEFENTKQPMEEDLDESLEIEVSIKDAKTASELLRDSFRGDYKQLSTNVFAFKDSELKDTAIDELKSHKIEILNEQLNELADTDKSTSIVVKYEKSDEKLVNSVLSDIENLEYFKTGEGVIALVDGTYTADDLKIIKDELGDENVVVNEEIDPNTGLEVGSIVETETGEKVTVIEVGDYKDLEESLEDENKLEDSEIPESEKVVVAETESGEQKLFLESELDTTVTPVLENFKKIRNYRKRIFESLSPLKTIAIYESLANDEEIENPLEALANSMGVDIEDAENKVVEAVDSVLMEEVEVMTEEELENEFNDEEVEAAKSGEVVVTENYSIKKLIRKIKINEAKTYPILTYNDEFGFNTTAIDVDPTKSDNEQIINALADAYDMENVGEVIGNKTVQRVKILKIKNGDGTIEYAIIGTTDENKAKEALKDTFDVTINEAVELEIESQIQDKLDEAEIDVDFDEEDSIDELNENLKKINKSILEKLYVVKNRVFEAGKKPKSKNQKIRDYLAKGLTVSEIAKKMGLTYQRVKNIEKANRA